jgi:hypothetical protein
MSYSVLESDFEGNEDNFEDGDTIVYHYGLKFEVVLKEDHETIPGKSILAHIIKNIKNNKKYTELLDILDAFDNIGHPELRGITPEQFPQNFKFETIGPNGRKLLFGLKIRSTIPYKTLKQRLFPYFQQHEIYMRLYSGNFDHGVNWVNLGFIMDIHPMFGNLEMITNNIMQHIVDGWHQDDHYWNKDRKAVLQQVFDPDGNQVFDPTQFPVAVRTDNITAKNKDGKQIRTYATTITTPAKLQRTGKMLLDYLFFTKRSLKNYIPMAFRTEDPNEFFELINQHENWMTNHRNIQLRNVTSTEQLYTIRSTVTNKTLEEIISEPPEVINIQFDAKRQRVNISITLDNYMAKIESLDRELRASQFEFPVHVKKPKQHITSSNSSTTSHFTVSYASALAFHKQDRNTKSVYTPHSHDNKSTTSKNSTRPWNQRPIPKTINFVDANKFPFFPSKETQPKDPGPKNPAAMPGQPKPEIRNWSISPHHTNTSTTSDTLSPPTVDKSIAEALDELNKKYRNELDELKSEIQDLKHINKTLKNIQLHQEEMDKKAQARSSGLEQRVEQLLAIFSDQTITNQPAEPEFIRPRKKKIIGSHFTTPEKKHTNPPHSPNRYSALAEADDNNEISAYEMDADDEDAATVIGDRGIHYVEFGLW